MQIDTIDYNRAIEKAAAAAVAAMIELSPDCFAVSKDVFLNDHSAKSIPEARAKAARHEEEAKASIAEALKNATYYFLKDIAIDEAAFDASYYGAFSSPDGMSVRDLL